MSFLAPLYLLTLLLAIPIVLLWFLKQRREPVEVPTTFLWRRALDEQRVSPLLQRLTTSLLLLLQLVALLLIAFAIAAAVLNLRLSGEARHVIVLLDTSASMGAREPDGSTRIEQAADRVRALLGNLRAEDQALLALFDDRARILSGFTKDAAALARLLDGVRPRDAATDPAEAFRVAEAAAAALPEGSAEVFLFSDGAFPPVEELPPGLARASLTFVGAGGAVDNAGIVSVRLESALDQAPRLFVTVANAGPNPASRTLSLRRGDTVIDAREAEIAPRSLAGSAFDLEGIDPGPLELRLDPGDALRADDSARLVLAETPVRRILIVTAGNPVLSRLRDFHPRVEVYEVAPADASPGMGEAAGRFDLTIFDGTVPPGVAPGHGGLGPSAVYLACVPDEPGVSLGAPLANPQVVDWDRSHPLNRNVDWSDVLVAEAMPVLAPAGAVALLETTDGNLACALPGTGTRVVFGFLLQESSFPLRLAFPVFFANLIDRAFHPGGASEAGVLAAGSTIVRPLPPGDDDATLVTPDGREVRLPALPDRTVAFADTQASGLYRLRTTEGTEDIPVALLSGPEADIEPRRTVDIAGEVRKSDPAALGANYPLRPALLLGALGVLLLEWCVWLRGAARRRTPAGAAPGTR